MLIYHILYLSEQTEFATDETSSEKCCDSHLTAKESLSKETSELPASTKIDESPQIETAVEVSSVF